LKEEDGTRHDDDTKNTDTKPKSPSSVVSLSAIDKKSENEVNFELMITHFP